MKYKISHPMQAVHMNAFTCLQCADGYYPGYDGEFTLPCTTCGDVKPSTLPHHVFMALVRARDHRMYREP